MSAGGAAFQHKQLDNDWRCFRCRQGQAERAERECRDGSEDVQYAWRNRKANLIDRLAFRVFGGKMGRLGLEPRTLSLKVRCSTIELPTLALKYCTQLGGESQEF